VSADPEIGGAPRPPLRILLVEDDDGDALLLERILSGGRYGSFAIRRAETLAAACREAAQGAVDLMLLDLTLPDSRGFETFVRLHATVPRVPIIVLTGMDDESLATQTVQQGAQDYVVKGQGNGVLLSRAIRYAIERCRSQQALADEHDLLRGLLDNMPDQVYVKDVNSRFVSVNAPTARFFGAVSPDQVVGKCDSDYFSTEAAAQFLEEEQAILRCNQSCINRETVVTDSAGNRRWVLTTKVPLRDHAGNITGLLGVNRDITERKEAEEAIRRLNAELEQRVTERTRELRKAMARLEEDDRARVEFISSVSHELKTPLTSMKLEIANLLEGVVGPVPEPVIEYLRMLDADCERMANTVGDILDLSRLESKTMRLHRVTLLIDRLVRHAAVALRAQAQRKHIDMVLSIAPGTGFVACDALKTLRAIINIIGNAIKFTPEGGRVDVGLSREASPRGALVVDITDNGIGIAPQHLPRVTEKYFRAGEHVSGAGLGLSIAKEIVELHGGRLTVQSPPPQRERGTWVSISLPAAEPPTVLIANEHGATREVIAGQLRALGYRIIPCSGQADVLEVARLTKPDVGLFDVSTAGMGEANLVFRVKADRALQGIPLVAIAGGLVGPAAEAILRELRIPLVPQGWREEDLLDRIEAAMMGSNGSSNGSNA
jgi:PAS domain S-box-containing protein